MIPTEQMRKLRLGRGGVSTGMKEVGPSQERPSGLRTAEPMLLPFTIPDTPLPASPRWGDPRSWLLRDLNATVIQFQK